MTERLSELEDTYDISGHSRAREAGMNWIMGFLVSIVVGHVVVWTVRHFMYKRLGVPETRVRAVSPTVMGIAERAFFTLVVGFEVTDAAVSMMAWVAVKMIGGWNRLGFKVEGETLEERAERATGAVFLSLLSMGFALIGGLICTGDIPIAWFTNLASPGSGLGIGEVTP